MVTKVKRIPINALEKAITGYAGEPVVKKEWHGLEITIKRGLCLKDYMQFVNDVTNMCFDENGVYMPEIRDFAMRCNLLEMYVNLTLPKNVEDKYQIVYAFDGYNMIMDEIDRTQFDAMVRAIDEKIQYVVDSNIETIKSKIVEMFSSLSALENKFQSMLEGVDGDTINKLVGAIADNKLDEEKLVRAFVSTGSVPNGASTDGPAGKDSAE